MVEKYFPPKLTIMAAASAVGAGILIISMMRRKRKKDQSGESQLQSKMFGVSTYEHWTSSSNKANHRSYRETDIPEVIRLATEKGLFGIDSVNPVAIFHDMDCQREILLALRAAYPSHFLHTFAVKSNPLPFVLRTAIELGMGLEAASFGEVANSIRQVCE